MPQPLSCQDAFTVIASILRTLCKDPLPDLTLDTSLNDLPGMDSLKALHAFALVEEQLGIEIDIAVLDHHPEQVRDIVHAACNARAQQSVEAGRQGVNDK
jgi:acyl carrier protein